MAVSEKNQIFKCKVCGNIVEVVNVGGGTLVCCGQPMQLIDERTQEGAREKHLPVVEKTEKGFKVTVGSVPHPMEEKHYIRWIEVMADGKLYRQYLNPNEAPEAEFEINAEHIEAREYCNLHGLWKTSF
jgi:superoxide reductase